MGWEWVEFKIIAQAVIAILLGGLLGLEREMAQKGAGLRTHMLVCFGAFMFVKCGELMIQQMESRYGGDADILRADPVRIIEAIVTGLSFIGAGIVFRDRERNVARGVTTAASVLMVAPIGIAVALEKYVLATGTTILVLIVLRCVLWFETRALDKSKSPPDPKS